MAGRGVDPAAIAVRSLHVIPAQDRIVPPGSSLALARAMAVADTLSPPLGHIGMITSRRAPRTLWPQLAERLRE